MKIDTSVGSSLAAFGEEAAAAEAAGYDGLWVGETSHDAFLGVLRARETTSRITLGTGVAIAFARTPMTVASTAYDLAAYTQGRFLLGLGSQVRAHVERRFSMPWSRPAARMREFVLALRAIWDSWEHGTPLSFRGEFYTHTLMTPFFSPQPHGFGPPPILVAAVGERMTEVAGEVADGVVFHPLTTPRYLEKVTLPALRRGRERADRQTGGLEVTGPVFVVAGRDDAELAAAVRGAKAQIAFYASTPAYRSVLDFHGWGDLQPELTARSKQGRWEDMGDLIDDKVVEAFAVVGSPAEAGRALLSRYGSLATRVRFYSPWEHGQDLWTDVLAAVRA